MKLFSNMSISEKREKLMELVEMRSNTTRRTRRKRKNEEPLTIGKEESLATRIIKRKKLFAHVYKKMFRNARMKVKALNQVNDIIAKECCPGSEHKKQRVVLDLEGDCFGNREFANEPSCISSMDEPVVQRGLGGFCAICMTGGILLLCSGRGCKKRFHRSCLDPPLTNTPPGSWQCGLCTKIKIKSGVHSELLEFRFEVSSEIHNHVLPYVNKLRDYWHRGQNAVIFDGKDRLLKVVFFVLSLLDNASRPILIIAASSVLSLWETEFSKWSNLVNVVTYKGSKDDRAAIRASGFYSEKGSITFQVLLSSPDVIVEDFEMIDGIKWDSLVLDECQSRKMSMHYKKIKMLVADMKLLTVTEEVDIKNVRQRYQYIFSLLDIHTDADMETNDDDTGTLKERLSPFIAFECKFSTTEIKEYWVPVHLSSTQIEQYCSILESNLEALSSCTKNMSLVHEILTQIRKCCDHPYLVDPTLRNSFNRVASIDPLSADIEVSGKLQVLDKLLLEIKRSGLRVVVLFRPGESLGNISIGDILDDFVHQRFGQDSYVHIPWKVRTEFERRNKKETLKMFNGVDNRKFICLVESRGCCSSMSLSHVDVVILFNSGWNPSADIRVLHKITDDTNREQLKVLRLYSPFTVEEKALFFSKQGAPLHSRMHNINWTTCHQLLSWGASYLFKDPTFESSFIDDLFHELLSLLRNTSGKTGPTNCSVISNAELHDGSYSKRILLLGETEGYTKESSSIDEDLIKNEFSVFWTNLLKESHHQRQKNSCKRSSRKVQKSPQNSCYLFEGFGADKGSPSIKRKARSKRKVHNRSGQSHWAGVRLHVGGRQSSEISPTLDQGETRRESSLFSPTEAQLPNAPPKSISEPLEAESERIQKEQEQDNKLHQEKKSMLLAECEKEISEIRKKYDALINESETCLAKERKIREDYQALVDANKLLAEILAQKFNDTLNPNITEKETSSLKIHHIPASTLIRPANPCSTSVLTTHFSGHNLRGSGIRAPAPHLRSNPSFFSSFRSRPTTLNPFLEPLLTQSTPQTLPHTQTKSKNGIRQII